MVVTGSRAKIERMIDSDDLAGLLRATALIHGHYCVGSAMGVMAAHYAMKKMNVLHNTGMEHLLAVVETNNCFSDGVQMVTGCSFGNNGLVYRDLGKMAFSLVERSGEGVRVSARPDANEVLADRSPEAQRMYTRMVNRRDVSPEEEARVLELNERHCFEVLGIPAERVFNLEKVKLDIPGYSRILSTRLCAKCGEKVIDTRSVKVNGLYYCLTCSDNRFNQLDWAGIHCERTSGREIDVG